MRTGKHLGVGRALLPPIPWFNSAALTDQNLKASGRGRPTPESRLVDSGFQLADTHVSARPIRSDRTTNMDPLLGDPPPGAASEPVGCIPDAGCATKWRKLSRTSRRDQGAALTDRPYAIAVCQPVKCARGTLFRRCQDFAVGCNSAWLRDVRLATFGHCSGHNPVVRPSPLAGNLDRGRPRQSHSPIVCGGRRHDG